MLGPKPQTLYQFCSSFGIRLKTTLTRPPSIPATKAPGASLGPNLRFPLPLNCSSINVTPAKAAVAGTDTDSAAAEAHVTTAAGFVETVSACAANERSADVRIPLGGGLKDASTDLRTSLGGVLEFAQDPRAGVPAVPELLNRIVTLVITTTAAEMPADDDALGVDGKNCNDNESSLDMRIPPSSAGADPTHPQGATVIMRGLDSYRHHALMAAWT